MHLEKDLLFLFAGLVALGTFACSGEPESEGRKAGKVRSGWLERSRVYPDTPVFRRIKKTVDKIRLVDTHEHLLSEKFWLEQDYSMFNWFRQPWFEQYSGTDLVSAGMPAEHLEAMKEPGVPLKERWAMAAPYWPYAKTTGFGQVLRMAVRDIYGIPDINDDTWEELCRRMKESQKPGFYKKVLHEMSGIDLIVLDQIVLPDPYVQSYFVAEDNRPRVVLVKRFDDTFIRLTQASLAEIAEDFGRPIQNLDDLLAALNRVFENIVSRGYYVGVKVAIAYDRELYFENVPRARAEKVFKKLLKGDLPDEQRKPFEDFMLHQVARRVGEHGLVMQIHTGMLAGGGNIQQTKPSHLNNLFEMYPKAKFAIFHGSFPYMGELAALAKNFQNVYLDNCWMPIISPTETKEWMHSWIETVPINKIMAFGGDYIFPEGSYGHSLVARQIVAEVLAEKVAKGYFTESEAIWVANRLLRQNAIDLFGLERFLN